MSKEQTHPKYRLLKDTHDANAGTILTYSENYGAYVYLNKRGEEDGCLMFSRDVQNNPEWFEELHKCQYCQAWTSSPDSECYKAPAHPESKSSVLEDKQWEILEFVTPFLGSNDVHFTRSNAGTFCTGLNGQIYEYTQERMLEEKRPIHSVKRLSDNVTFSVGDKIAWDWEDSIKSSFKITGFRVISDGIPTLMIDCDFTTQNFNAVNKRNLRIVTEPATPSIKEDTPVKESIEIVDELEFNYHTKMLSPDYQQTYHSLFHHNKIIPRDKFPAIKKAIEAALNEDTVVGDKYWAVQNNTLELLECVHPLLKPDNWVVFKTKSEAEQYIAETKSYNIDFKKPLSVNFIDLHNKYYPNTKVFLKSEVDAMMENVFYEKQCQSIYNQAIDHAISIIKDYPFYPSDMHEVTKSQIINSLSNLKKK